ncbi:MgtC/SapB family protein [Marinobacterium aestuariivivens]|uniref:MgtC/SapB family protein n=1 Tax=Marinobacterium aestuariivivens TaxID=1698799 RepID=A0ABW2A8P0_9GAMM
MDDYTVQLSHLLLFGQSLGIGFLVGLERERHANSIAGLRTFTLISLSGSLGGYISLEFERPYFVLMMLLLVIASLLVAQFKSRASEPDTTTVLAAILTFGLGYMLWADFKLLPAALAITMTAILYYREELHEVPHRLTRKDVSSFFQFAAIAFILLPVLPDDTYGPYQVFNPYQTGWLVVLISAISLTGYVVLRLLGSRSGIFVMGLLGGLVSTTATTLIYARHSKRQASFAGLAATIILLSHLVLFIRVAIVVAVLELSLLVPMLPWLVGGFALGAGYIAWHYHRTDGDKEQYRMPAFEVSNPAEIKVAVGFAISFALVLLLVAWTNDVFSHAGVYVVAFLSGLTDIDAITISNIRLFSVGNLSAPVTLTAVVLAFLANLIFKLGIVFVVGDRNVQAPVLWGFLCLASGAVTGLVLSLVRL